MGGRDDGAAVQRKAQLRPLSALPALRVQDSTERVDPSGIAHHPVPEVRRRIRPDGEPETHQHILSAAFPRNGIHWGPVPSERALSMQAASFIETMDCLPVSNLPDGPEWTYEIKLDGYRLEAVRNGRMTTLYSRRENVLNQRFTYIATALQDLPNKTVIDGELVALGPDGRPDFHLLQNFRFAESRIGGLRDDQVTF
jgi:ATP dependent DNA ligase domain